MTESKQTLPQPLADTALELVTGGAELAAWHELTISGDVAPAASGPTGGPRVKVFDGRG